MKTEELISTIKKKILQFKIEYIPLYKRIFEKKTTFKDNELNRAVWLEQRMDDLTKILDILNKKRNLHSYHLDILKKADITLK